jgi:hypothetical protein
MRTERDHRTQVAEPSAVVGASQEPAPAGLSARGFDASALASMPAEQRAGTLARLQATAGNAAVARLMARPEGPTLARDGGVVAGLVLGGVAIVQSQINASNGGLSYTSDQITYPKDQPRAEGLTHKEIPVAHFLSTGTVMDNDTMFKLYGDFASLPGQSPVMANVYVDLASTTTYYTSALSFKATALQTAYGTAERPTIRFLCTGRFDPAGQGDTMYRVVIEVGHTGTVGIVSKEIVNGDGTIHDMVPGFEVRSGAMFRPPESKPVVEDPLPPDLSGAGR